MTTRDYLKAVDLYSKAAEQGYSITIFNLVVMCENGIGLERDYSHAVQLYLAAAETGLAAAQFNLGELYTSLPG